jgi:gliding motility-associated-like protein
MAEFTLIIDKGNCPSKPSPIKKVTILSAPIATINSEKSFFCPGELINLAGADPGTNHTFSWFGPSGFSSSLRIPAPFLATDPSQSGTYFFTVNNGVCDSPPDSVVLSVALKPLTPVPGGPLQTCEGSTVILNANYPTASIYYWMNPVGELITTNADSLVITDIQMDATGPWRLTVLEGECASDTSAAIQLTVNPKPFVTAAAARFIVCQNDPLQLSAATSIPVASFQWSGPAGFSSTLANPSLASFQANNAGTYQVEVTTDKGCKATGTVNIAIDTAPAILQIEDNTPTCPQGNDTISLFPTLNIADESGLTFLWSGPMNYTTDTKIAQITHSGTFTLSVINSNNCKSSDSISITIPPILTKPPVPSIQDGNLCEGEKTILFAGIPASDGQTFTWFTPTGQLTTSSAFFEIPSVNNDAAGNYAVRINKNNCSSPISDNYALLPKPIPTVKATSNSPVCEGSPIRLFADAPQGTQFQWAGPNFSATTSNPILNNGSSGTYTLTGTLNGCKGKTDSIEIVFLPAPKTPLVLTGGPVCLDAPEPKLLLQIAETTTVPNAIYYWYRGNILIDSTNVSFLEVTNFDGLNEGVVSFFAQTLNNGCLSARSPAAQVSLNTIPLSNAFAGTDKEICSETVLFLDAALPDIGTGNWTIISGPPSGVVIANPANPKTQVTNLATDTTYIFRWTLSNGVCTNYSFDDVTIKISSQSAINAGEEILACASTEIRLNATPVSFGTGRWRQGQVQQLLGVRILEPTNPNTPITGLVPGNLYQFIWEVTSACGTGTDQVLVLISDPNPFAGFDFSVCGEEGEVNLNAREPTSGSRGKWSAINPQIQFVDPDKPSTQASGLEVGSNIFVWTIDEAICEDNSRDTLIVHYTPIPQAADDESEVPFGKEILIDVLQNDQTFGLKAILSIIQNPLNGVATIVGDTAILYQPNGKFIGTDELVYEICLEDCECSMAKVILEIGADAPCTIPTIFTPNGDGINDQFIIQCLLNDTTYPQSQLIVFNNWGDEVFRSTIPYKNDWEGNYRGVPLPAGTYYYILNFGDSQKPAAGFVVIQR